MTYQLDEIHEIQITAQDGGFRVDFLECGCRLNSEIWAQLNDIFWYYGID